MTISLIRRIVVKSGDREGGSQNRESPAEIGRVGTFVTNISIIYNMILIKLDLKGAPFENYFGFVGGIVRAICKPDVKQRLL